MRISTDFIETILKTETWKGDLLELIMLLMEAYDKYQKLNIHQDQENQSCNSDEFQKAPMKERHINPFNVLKSEKIPKHSKENSEIQLNLNESDPVVFNNDMISSHVDTISNSENVHQLDKNNEVKKRKLRGLLFENTDNSNKYEFKNNNFIFNKKSLNEDKTNKKEDLEEKVLINIILFFYKI